PEICGMKMNRSIEHEERIRDQHCREDGKKSHSFATKVFSDDIRHHKHHGPKQHTCSEVEGKRIPENYEIEWFSSESLLQAEQLHAHDLSDQCIVHKDPREDDEQSRGLMINY